MVKPKTSLTAFERRTEELDTIAAVLPMERRDELAELLTDHDVESLRHLVNRRPGDGRQHTSRPHLRSRLSRSMGTGGDW